ncbi:hypothetical protein M422DRAFT_783881 [Sphaerobolus stellatus SS14]|uniref:Unplaced genomic scaffold SPHSTscaffold_178, whole genome shotgun sequence n=1 Tax=Sphaerobolus stellatus (strain SS14) TaxID=990650 RepID=A0A0C9TLW0_SPHS4|nr:hypothetical protein M422DRAFT_783881 [Sphaerobolus stellatus SS14]
MPEGFTVVKDSERRYNSPPPSPPPPIHKGVANAPSPNIGTVNNEDVLMPAIATLLATIPVAFLSYAQSIFSARASNGGPTHRRTDDAVTVMWYISTAFALASVVFRAKPTQFSRLLLTAAVITLIAGLITFSAAEQPLSVSVTFGIVVAGILLGATVVK